MSSGMHFHGQVTVMGNVVNIEGNQYNFIENTKLEVLAAISKILDTAITGGDINSALPALDLKLTERGDISKEEIGQNIQANLNKKVDKTSLKEKLNNILEQLTIGTSGSLLASGIVHGIKLYLGLPL